MVLKTETRLWQIFASRRVLVTLLFSAMAADGDSFLPRIQSVFYAVFDVHQGPKIVYQVPEGLISSSSGTTSFSSSPVPQATPSPSTEHSSSGSRASSISIASPPLYQTESRSKIFSPQKRSLSATRTLFNFDDISQYVIPRSMLCGRLVICAAKKYRVIGFPTQLRGNYERNYFFFNLCFVFDRSADLSCYEPIVRKVNRVLTACEVRSSCSPSELSSTLTRRHRKNRPFYLHPKARSKYTPFWSSYMRTSTLTPRRLSRWISSTP